MNTKKQPVETENVFLGEGAAQEEALRQMMGRSCLEKILGLLGSWFIRGLLLLSKAVNAGSI